MRIGHGFDVHAFTKDRPCIIGGVTIPYERGLWGHSDADVCVHALMDALLSAARQGDIGQLFPPDDPKYDNADSCKLLREVQLLIATVPLQLKRLRFRHIVNLCARNWQRLWIYRLSI